MLLFSKMKPHFSNAIGSGHNYFPHPCNTGSFCGHSTVVQTLKPNAHLGTGPLLHLQPDSMV